MPIPIELPAAHQVVVETGVSLALDAPYPNSGALSLGLTWHPKPMLGVHLFASQVLGESHDRCGDPQSEIGYCGLYAGIDFEWVTPSVLGQVRGEVSVAPIEGIVEFGGALHRFDIAFHLGLGAARVADVLDWIVYPDSSLQDPRWDATTDYGFSLEAAVTSCLMLRLGWREMLFIDADRGLFPTLFSTGIVDFGVGFVLGPRA